MRPDTPHFAVTCCEVNDNLVASTQGAMFNGSHFMCDTTMHATLLGTIRDRISNGSVTNSDHIDTKAALHRMVFRALHGYRKYLHDNKLATMQVGHKKRIYNADFNHLSVCCLIYMTLTPEWFMGPVKRGSPASRLPETFYRQRRNARTAAFELLCIIKIHDKETWRTWCTVCAEVNDRCLHEDDVVSPARRLITAAQERSDSENHESTGSVFDLLFRPARLEYYQDMVHPTTEHPDHPNVLVKEVPFWSSVAEGTFHFDEKSGTAAFPGIYQANLPRVFDVVSPLREGCSELQPSAEFGTTFSKRKHIALAEYMSAAIPEDAESRSETFGNDWFEMVEGGRLDSSEWWVGTIVQEDVVERDEDPGDNGSAESGDESDAKMTGSGEDVKSFESSDTDDSM